MATYAKRAAVACSHSSSSRSSPGPILEALAMDKGGQRWSAWTHSSVGEPDRGVDLAVQILTLLLVVGAVSGWTNSSHGSFQCRCHRWMDELSFAAMGEARSRRATMEPNVSDDRDVDWADCKATLEGVEMVAGRGGALRHLPPPPLIESFAFHRESSEPHCRSSSGRVIGDRAANIVGFDNLENNDFELADSVMPFGGEKRDQGHRLKELRSIGPSRMVRIRGCLVAAVYIRQ
ncbi:hypothetical protein NL676_034422 [Syzygium grande]|nr:hypothetical protein NL676_034422 [Syzygium grande]